MSDFDDQRQCQECLSSFTTNAELRRHLEKFRKWSRRIRKWDESCRAHIEPVIDIDEPDELDVDLCRDHHALLKARVCPVDGCDKRFNEKKQLNIHFETHDDFPCPEICVVCHTSFSNVHKFLVHTTHPEAVERHRVYIQIARTELRTDARQRLHRMLIEASNRKTRTGKRRPEAVSEDQPPKRLRMAADTEQASNSGLQVQVGSLEPSLLGQSMPRDPYAAPMFHSGDESVNNDDPYAARLYNQRGCNALVDGYNGFLPFAGGEYDALGFPVVSVQVPGE